MKNKLWSVEKCSRDRNITAHDFHDQDELQSFLKFEIVDDNRERINEIHHF